MQAVGMGSTRNFRASDRSLRVPCGSGRVEASGLGALFGFLETGRNGRSFAAEAIEVGRVDGGEAFQPQVIEALLVGRNEQNVRAFHERFFGVCE